MSWLECSESSNLLAPQQCVLCSGNEGVINDFNLSKVLKETQIFTKENFADDS